MRFPRFISSRAAPFGAALEAEPLAPVIIASAAFVILGGALGATNGLGRTTLPRAIEQVSGVSALEQLFIPEDAPSASASPRTPLQLPTARPVPTTTPAPTASSQAAAPAAPAAPRAPAARDTTGVTGVRIPRIGVNALTIDLGLESDGSLEVPSIFSQTGWWTGGPEPGQVGPSVIVGHVSSKRGPAVFIDLDKLINGDEVHVDFADGRIETFTVLWSAEYRKSDFPTNLVYGPTDTPTLRLITCGGEIDGATRRFDSNVVVFLQHTSTTPAA